MHDGLAGADAGAARGPWWAELPPAAGAAVMATCILSIGLHLIGYGVPSLVFFALAGLGWVLLAGEFLVRLFGSHARWHAEADTPPALTAVAATTVVGMRCVQSGWTGLASALLVVAALVWPVLIVTVVAHWHRRMPGSAFLVCVATQGLAVLAAALAPAVGAHWLGDAALGAFCLGLLLYVEALVRFDFRQLREGGGDHWIAGGALAISALAAARLYALPQWTGAGHDLLRGLTVTLNVLDLAWCVVLLTAETRWPRPAYDIRRWATVFPLGMSGVACLSTAAATGLDWLHSTGLVLLWIALGLWLVTAGALVLSLVRERSAGAV
ncbi:tellurite resistance/C4-dicarboxylate transporter family protein [Streptomyces bambusae]|uniref:tellurite resistance/C4-dicarboxylate transporter family protein n=1 Tax=Streptomyces bambusae TaxID=1550616 RepID=UPI001CFF1D29|nr:tellurite resistance/C4-dicarboxylate transporter family protein [Streptomyces bambusae]MCB5168430.1 tellurite resistance/C4-dicarboxylate transporter family protein [Streptomyces bambusae]